jgi:hypothetical protein
MEEEATLRAMITTFLLRNILTGQTKEHGGMPPPAERKVLAVQCADIARDIVRLSKITDKDFYASDDANAYH